MAQIPEANLIMASHAQSYAPKACFDLALLFYLICASVKRYLSAVYIPSQLIIGNGRLQKRHQKDLFTQWFKSLYLALLTNIKILFDETIVAEGHPVCEP